jgi:hypothetical protein
VVLGMSLVRMGAVVCEEVLTSHVLAHLSLGAHSSGVTFQIGEAFPLSIPQAPCDFSLGLVLGKFFLGSLHLSLGEIPSVERLG